MTNFSLTTFGESGELT
jgi:20S proteasome subunit alpha 2